MTTRTRAAMAMVRVFMCASFGPPAEASARSLTQAMGRASRHAVTTKIARKTDRADQVDYAGLVTSSDFTVNTGESSVERSIMVVRSTHEGHPIHRGSDR